MELSLMTFSFQTERLTHGMNAEKLCQMAKENGIGQIDLMTTEVFLYGKKALKKAFEETGVRCDCLIAHLPFYRNVEKYPEQLMKAFRTCEDLGVRELMTIPGSADQKACELLSDEEMKARAVELFRMAVERGRQKGIEILFEDTPQAHKLLSRAQDCLEILKEAEGLGFVFDTANFMVGDPNFDLIADYELLKQYIRRIHVKDVVCGHFSYGEARKDKEMMRCVPTGSGIVPLEPFLKRINEDGYDGTLCIEYAYCGDVHGTDHSKYISLYAQNIRGMYEGNRILPEYSRIEGLDKPVSRIFFGTAVRTLMTGRKSWSLLDCALAAGINAFDCARGYGFAEKALGSWIKERNNRDRVVLLTKCGNVNAKGEVKVDREVIMRELDQSLKALGVDYIDIYLLHRDDPNTSVKELIDTLNECQRQGKIKVFGVSNWAAERIREANDYAKQNGLSGFSISSPYYGLADQIEDPWGGNCIAITGDRNADQRNFYEETQMPVLSYSSMGRGFFSGRFKAYDYEGAAKILDKAGQKGYLHKENMDRLKRAEELAERYSTNVGDIALRYIFSNRMNLFAIVSTENPKRFLSNIRSANSPLTPEETEWLETGNR